MKRILGSIDEEQVDSIKRYIDVEIPFILDNLYDSVESYNDKQISKLYSLLSNFYNSIEEVVAENQAKWKN